MADMQTIDTIVAMGLIIMSIDIIYRDTYILLKASNRKLRSYKSCWLLFQAHEYNGLSA